MKFRALLLLALFVGIVAAAQSRGRLSAPASTISTASAPLVITSGDIACTAASASSGGCLTSSGGSLVADAGFLDTISVTSPTFSASAASAAVAYQSLTGAKSCFVTGGTNCITGSASTLFSSFQTSAPNYLATSTSTAPWSSGMTSDNYVIDNGSGWGLVSQTSRTQMVLRTSGAAVGINIDGSAQTVTTPLAMHCSSTKTVGTITLSSGTGTATVLSGAICVCTDTSATPLVLQCAVSSTTLTATQATGSHVISYICL